MDSMEMKQAKTINKTAKNIHFAVLAADVVPITLKNGELWIRLIKVNRPPHYINAKGLPGGLLRPDETADQAAARNLAEKADLRNAYLEQLYTFSGVNRDPRGRVVAVAYLALIPWNELSKESKQDSDSSWWAPISRISKLAYDHNEILKVAKDRLKARITYSTVISKILPGEFTLTELEKAYEVILEKGIDKRNFRKKIMKLKLLTRLNRERRGLKWRPARLYSFRTDKVEHMEIL